MQSLFMMFLVSLFKFVVKMFSTKIPTPKKYRDQQNPLFNDTRIQMQTSEACKTGKGMTTPYIFFCFATRSFLHLVILLTFKSNKDAQEEYTRVIKKNS